MYIIEGFDNNKKLKQLASKLVRLSQPMIIIGENKEYIEDIFLQYTDVLFNIEIKTLNEFERDFLIKNKIFNVHIYDHAELIFKIRHLLFTEDFHYFHMSSNPYNLIDEIIKTLRIVHDNSITLATDRDDPVLRNKIEDLQKIDDQLSKEGYFSLTEALLPLIEKGFETDLYVLGDDYTNRNERLLFEKIDTFTNVTMLLSCDEGTRLECMENSFYKGEKIADSDDSFLTTHLFDLEPVKESIGQADEIVGGNVMHEVMKVTSDIRDRLVYDQARYRDFMIIVNDDIYRDYLRNVLDACQLPHDIDTIKSFYYDPSFIHIMKALETSTAKTYHEIISSLRDVEMDDQYRNLISAYDSDEAISPQEYLFFLTHALKDTRVSVKTHDCIHVTSLERAFSATPKYVYMMGFNEGILPSIPHVDSILLENEFTALDHQPLSFVEELGHEYMELIRSLLIPHQRLTFSYSNMDMNGKQLIKSSLLSRLENIFSIRKPEIDLMNLRHCLYLGNSRIPADPVNDLIDQTLVTKNNAILIDPVYRSRLGKGSSVSRIETYIKCPFQYYMKYGLKIMARHEKDLTAMELGSLCHYIMEKALSDPDHCARYGYEYVQLNLLEKYNDDLVNKYFIDHLIEDMRTNIVIINKWLERDMFKPLDYEEEIIGSFGQIPIKGKIDRIDAYDQYVRVIDYKSSEKKLDLSLAAQGFNIQMLIYLDMLLKKEDLEPAGVLYYSMKRRRLAKKEDKNLSLAHIKDHSIDHKAYEKQFKMTGYVIDEGEYQVVKASAENSIPAVLTIAGKPDARYSKIISKAEFRQLVDYITVYVNEIYDHLKSGHIEIHPTQADNDDNAGVYPCTNCDYRDVCLYDDFYNDKKKVYGKFNDWRKKDEQLQ